MGCFEDRIDNRDLNGVSKLFDSLTPDRCFDFCHNSGFKYAGLQDG